MLSVDIAGATRPRPDQAIGGDFTFIRQQDDYVWVLCMDVLGHGPVAYEVTTRVASYLDPLEEFEPLEVLKDLNDLLHGGRGAAISICLVDLQQHLMHFVGIGNVLVRKFSPASQTLVSRDGVVGEHIRQAEIQQVPLQPGDIFLLHTDGVQSRFTLPQYRHIISDSATKASSFILQNFSKAHDDAGCIVLKVKP